jgi:AcrR family transcriptional regulator
MLRAAGAVFAARGFHAASMDEIAERVGVSKPMIYSFFGSKEALYFAYIEEAGRDLLAGIVDAERAVRHESVERRLSAGSLAFFCFVDEHRDGYSVLFSEMAAAGGPLRREVSAIRRQILELVQALLDQVTREAGVDADAIGGTEAYAQAYVGAGESLANWWLEHPDEDVEAINARLLNLAWTGLEKVLAGGASSGTTGG